MNLVLLDSFDNYIDAHIVLGRLEEEGIHCWLKDENTVTVTPFFNNAVGGIKLMVDKEQFQKACELLNEFQRQKKSKLACPNCGSHEIELIPYGKPANIVGAIATWLTGNYALSMSNVWHCFNCKQEFKEPSDNSHQNDETGLTNNKGEES